MNGQALTLKRTVMTAGPLTQPPDNLMQWSRYAYPVRGITRPGAAQLADLLVSKGKPGDPRAVGVDRPLDEAAPHHRRPPPPPYHGGVACCILMSMNTQLLEQAAKLSVNERNELVEATLDTLHESQNELPLTAAQIALLDKRLTAYRENPQGGSPWAEVRARLERLT